MLKNSNPNLQPALLRSHWANERRVSLGSHYHLIDSWASTSPPKLPIGTGLEVLYMDPCSLPCPPSPIQPEGCLSLSLLWWSLLHAWPPHMLGLPACSPASHHDGQSKLLFGNVSISNVCLYYYHVGRLWHPLHSLPSLKGWIPLCVHS